MQTNYPIRIEAVAGDWQVSCRDLPGLITSADTYEAALDAAADALDVLVGYQIDKDLGLPAPSALEPGEIAVPLPAQLAVKASVYRAWKAAGISKSELARRMGVADTEAHRVLDARHTTRLDRMARAAEVLGKRIVVTIEDAAA